MRNEAEIDEVLFGLRRLMENESERERVTLEAAMALTTIAMKMSSPEILVGSVTDLIPKLMVDLNILTALNMELKRRGLNLFETLLTKEKK